MHPDRRLDFIDNKDYESTYQYNFRVVCIELSSGKKYLITNLPDSFSMNELKEYIQCDMGTVLIDTIILPDSLSAVQKRHVKSSLFQNIHPHSIHKTELLC